MSQIDEIEIFSDGSCIGNPGPGGWAALVQQKSNGEMIKEQIISGSNSWTTNNRMELFGAIEGLKAVKSLQTRLTITVDSQYVKDGIEKWIANWKKNGWRTATRKPVINKDLWTQLDETVSRLDVTWKWTKGHAKCEGNNRVDVEARNRAEEIKEQTQPPIEPKKRKNPESTQSPLKIQKTDV